MSYVLGGTSPQMSSNDSQQSEVEDSSAYSNYSSETFESFTEEEGKKEVVETEEECLLTEGKPSDSLVSSEVSQNRSGASGSHPGSKKLIPSLKDEDESTNLLDSAALEEKLSQRWIQLLKTKENHTGQCQVDPTSQAVVEASRSELDALQAFCSTKIKVIHHQLKPQEINGSSQQKRQQGLDAEKPATDEGNNCVVPRSLMNRISHQNLRASVDKGLAVKEHQCSWCPECSKKRGELSQITFLRQKKTFLESALLREKMEEQCHTKDFLSFIGEMHSSLPKLSNAPETIWKRLNARGHVG
ncbi:uncharacterized protein C8orf48-like [Macrotis lagotis]|uniref:uncharacterized protein C8orf48-like n=1 Tax=Macrotis lagotis TaxID=92651 RepID=UPI003D69CC4C